MLSTSLVVTATAGATAFVVAVVMVAAFVMMGDGDSSRRCCYVGNLRSLRFFVAVTVAGVEFLSFTSCFCLSLAFIVVVVVASAARFVCFLFFVVTAVAAAVVFVVFFVLCVCFRFCSLCFLLVLFFLLAVGTDADAPPPSMIGGGSSIDRIVDTLGITPVNA